MLLFLTIHAKLVRGELGVEVGDVILGATKMKEGLSVGVILVMSSLKTRLASR